MKSNIKLFISALFVLLIFNCKNEANNGESNTTVETETTEERTGQGPPFRRYRRPNRRQQPKSARPPSAQPGGTEHDHPGTLFPADDGPR